MNSIKLKLIVSLTMLIAFSSTAAHANLLKWFRTGDVQNTGTSSKLMPTPANVIKQIGKPITTLEKMRSVGLNYLKTNIASPAAAEGFQVSRYSEHRTGVNGVTVTVKQGSVTAERVFVMPEGFNPLSSKASQLIEHSRIVLNSAKGTIDHLKRTTDNRNPGQHLKAQISLKDGLRTAVVHKWPNI